MVITIIVGCPSILNIFMDGVKVLPKMFWTKFFEPKIFQDPNICWVILNFEPEMILEQNFVWHNRDPKFVVHIFVIILDLKLLDFINFWAQSFLDLIFFWTKNFLDKKSFWTQN